MNSKTPVYIVLALTAILGICACVSATAFGAYFVFRDEINAVISDPSLLFREPGANPALQPQVPVGEEINLSDLFAPMWEARQYLHEDFVNQPIDDRAMAQGAIEGLTAFLDSRGVDISQVQAPADAPSAETLSLQANTPGEISSDFSSFWETWRSAQYGSTGVVVSYQELEQAALRGMVEALGEPHTAYLDPFELQQSDLSLEGNYEGIGAWVDTTTEYVTIIAPMPDSPAEKAGLLAGDVVIAIDGEDMTGVDGNVVVSHILGPAGTTVVLTILREGESDGEVTAVYTLAGNFTIVGEGDELLTVIPPGSFDLASLRVGAQVLVEGSQEAGVITATSVEILPEAEPFDVEVARAAITVPSVETKMLDGNIAYIQLFTFGADSSTEMHSALEDMLAQNPDGLILDLRNNGGGFLNTAVDISSEFMTDGVALYEEYGDGTRDSYTLQGGGLAIDIPMVVLVNGGTASASEILAGAIQDYGRAQLVGETTFGKGSVQISRNLSNDQGALRITIAHWLTPNERHIDGVGLEPDVVVPLTDEDVQAQRDPQLDRAVELLNGSASN